MDLADNDLLDLLWEPGLAREPQRCVECREVLMLGPKPVNHSPQVFERRNCP